MATRPTTPQRWPRHAEAQRQATIEDCRDALELLGTARREFRRNPMLGELMIEAKVGAEPTE